MKRINLALLVMCFLVLTSLSFGAVSISAGNTVTQNFDALGTTAIATMPTDWKADKLTTARTLNTYTGASTATEQYAGNSMSSTAANGIYNYGAGVQNVATDRALGWISSSSATKSGNLYVLLNNGGGSSITSFNISYDVEKYRLGTNAAGFSVQMYYSTNGTSWTSAGSDFLTSFAGGDATNNGYTTAPGATTSVTNKTLTVTVAASGNLYLAWNYSVTTGTTTSSAQALGIDNISIGAVGGSSLATEPTSRPTSLQFGSVLDTSFNVSFTAASPTVDGYIAVRKTGSAPTTDPVDGTAYTAGNTLGDGTVVFSGSGVSFSQSGLTASTTYYYKVYPFNGSAATTNYLITTPLSGSQATTAGATPTISLSQSTLTGFNYTVGSGPSTTQTFTVGGTNLTADISIAASTNYEISKSSGSGYTTPLTFTQSGGTVTTTTVYVRLKAGLSTASYNSEVLTASSTGASNQTVTCSGSVSAVAVPSAPVATAATEITSGSFISNWNSASGATSYRLDVYTGSAGGAITDLFISEYVEGSGSNKYIEIYNGTGASIDLSNYKLQLYSNGSATVANDITLSGTLASGACAVYKNSSAALTLPGGVTATANAAVNFNGDDAVVLYKISTSSYVDIFGKIGEDPGASWGTTPLISVDKTLVRKGSVTGGVTTNPTTGFPTIATEWDSYASDTATYLGSHSLSREITYVSGYQDLNVGNVYTYPVSGLSASTLYHYVVRGVNDSGPSANSNAIDATTSAGTSLATEPTAQPTSLVFSSVTANTFTVSYTAASPVADGYLAIRKSGSAPTTDPVDGTAYTAGTTLGDGTVVYSGSAATFSQSTLSPSTTYYYKIYAFNGSATTTNYLTTTPLAGSQATTASDPFGGYYNSVTGLNGTALKAGLHTILKNTHTTEFGYSNLEEQLKVTDEDPENSSNVIEIYTGWSVPKSAYGGGITDWNKEHVWSKSHGFSEAAPAGTDLHHMRPSDATVNSAKSNRDFDEGSTAYTDASPYGSYSGVTGCYTSSNIWEPREVEKGDVARMILYMAVRYESDDLYDLEMVDYVNSSPSGEPLYGKLSTLLLWNSQDPPDAWEALRNNRIQSLQGNRNPFVDHPEYISSIWGGTSAPSVTTTAITSISFDSASGGGEVTAAGSSTVTARGICWNTVTAPTLDHYYTSNGNGTGTFTSSLTSLTGGQQYFVRAYATNSFGTTYGNEVSFTTLKAEPTAHATSFATGTTTSATIPLTWVDATADGYLIKGSSVSYAAITAPADGTPESDATLVRNVVQGTQTYTFTGLTASTTYYFKIYPYNNATTNINYKTDGTVPQVSAATGAAAGASVTLRPTHIDLSATSSESAVKMTLAGYSSNDARYRLYNGSNQYNCWDAATSAYITATTYTGAVQVPGTPTTSSTFWIMFQRGNNATKTASYRDRLNPFTANYQTVVLTAIDSITTSFALSGTYTGSIGYPLTAKYVVLAYNGSTLVSAASTALTTGALSVACPTGTTIDKIEIRTPLDVLVESKTGSWTTTTDVGSFGATIDPEPANHVTSFATGTPTSVTIPLTWTDATAAGYLIKGSSVGYGDIVAPVDGTAETNGALVQNVAQGAQTYTFTGLTASTTYYFQIYPYSNSGANINYKTDGSVPQASIATSAPAPSLVVTPPTMTFSTLVGETSTQTATVASSNLSAGITVSSAGPFTFCETSGGTYTNPLVLATDYNGSVYVKFAPLAETTYTDSIAFVSGALYDTIMPTAEGTTTTSTLFVVENFDYTAATLLTTHGWTNHSGTTNYIPVSATGLTYSGYPAVGGSASLLTSGEDVNKTFTAQTTGSIYSSLLINVSSSQTAGDYIFHFGTNVWTTSFYAKLFIKKDTSTTNYAFGLSRSAAVGSASFTGFNYVPGTTYLVVLKYTFVDGTANDEVKLFINPTFPGTEPTADITVTTGDTTTDATSIGGIALRQGSSTNAAAALIDGIRVANSWSSIFPSDSPVINITSSFTAFSSVAGNPSDAQSYTVSGSNLNGNIGVKAPTGYELSTNQATWVDSLSLVPAYRGTVYVRLNSATSGTFNGNIVHTSLGATTVNTAVTGSVTAPDGEIVVVEDLTPFTAFTGTPSAIQSYTLTGSDLTGLTLDIASMTSAGATFEVRAAEGDGVWHTDLELLPTFDGLIEIRFNASVAGTYNGTITHYSDDVIDNVIEVTGVATDPTPVITVTPSTMTFSATVETNSAAQSCTVASANLSAPIDIASSGSYVFCTTETGTYNSTLQVAANFNGAIWIKFAPMSLGTFNDTITFTSGAVADTIFTTGHGLESGTLYATDLLISEYIEGTSNNKGLEIFNGTGFSVNLSNYRMAHYNNGSSTVSYSFTYPNVMLAHGDCYTIVHNSAGTTLKALADSVLASNNNTCNFNGDDALALQKTSNGTDWVTLDIFGRIGNDPGDYWNGDGGYSTKDKTLVRKSSIYTGISVSPTGTGPTAFTTLTTEWDLYDVDTFSNFDIHTFTPGLTPAVAPIILPTVGLQTAPVMVSMSSTTPGAEIRYTIDGNDPDEGSGLYTTEFEVSSTTTVKARTYATGYAASSITSATYIYPEEMGDIATLRAQTVGTGVYYKLTGEAVLTLKSTTRNTKYIQDATGAILIDDLAGKITTSYNLGDGITGIIGTLVYYAGMLQFTPALDPGTATSTGNVITPEVVTLAELNTTHQAKLVRIDNVTFSGATGNFASPASNYVISDASGLGVCRDQYTDLDYVGTPVPTTPKTIVGVILQYTSGTPAVTTMQFVPRSLADFTDGAAPDAPIEVKITRVGDNLQLSWADDPTVSSWTIWSCDTFIGEYSNVGTYSVNYCTIDNISSAQAQRFYYVIANR